MDDTLVDEVKGELDQALAHRNLHVGILFSDDLFSEFYKRGLLTLENFLQWGTAPAYRKTHLAIRTWEPGIKFRVGNDL
jgi:hypothetical protein